ncbi:MAG: PEGA domain-containing protein [Spirochaetota bacterium]|nr:MAG: PEGA domain-containing protein [Spirochaetota bacterium]
MNRINRFILIFISLFLTFLVVYIYIRERIGPEPDTIVAPFQIEVYRVDRFRLPNADIYLNQRFLGRSDENGFFQKNIPLIVGESYTLRVEKDNDGYEYGPWETRFKVEEDKRKRPKERDTEEEPMPALEGEFDILTELERAQLGKASILEKYHFLAILEGSMYYTIEVVGKQKNPARNATVFVNGKEEGKTSYRGVFEIHYTGEDQRLEKIKILKEGEHIWMNDVNIYPDASITIELNNMLLVDLFSYTENYDSIKGIANANVFLKGKFMGRTNADGLCTFKYENEQGVDGELELIIQYPEGIVPERVTRSFSIKSDMPKLSVVDFAYSLDPVSPDIAVFPFVVEDRSDYQLVKMAEDLKTNIEDYLSLSDIFTLVSSKDARDLFREFDIDFRGESGWKDIALIKDEVDAIIYGEIGGSYNVYDIVLTAKSYTGEKIFETHKIIPLRKFHSVAEEFSYDLKRYFPFEGNVTSINRLVYINLGSRFGLKDNNKFYCFYNYFDEKRKDYSKRNIARLRIVDIDENSSASELESITEGFLLEKGMKVKRYRDPETEEELISVKLVVKSNKRIVPDANVYIDEYWVGQTDEKGELGLSVLENAQVNILVYKEGFQPGNFVVKVDKGSEAIDVELQQGKTQLYIETYPEGAQVFVDGEYMGTTPILKQGLVVPYGFHLLEIELEGYKKYREYINFNDTKLSFTGDTKILLFSDLMSRAEAYYQDKKIMESITTLKAVGAEHPDYIKALDFLGFIYLYEIMDFKSAIANYTKALSLIDESAPLIEYVFTYYNLAQSYYNEAEKLFYTDGDSARFNYLNAVRYFQIVHQRRSRIFSQDRKNVNLNTLFYLAVSYQKIYYLTGKGEYLTQAYYAWQSYFDFFDEALLTENHFKKQYDIAVTYNEEVQRLQGER